MFKDKVLLITGGTGSFGNTVLKRFLNSDLSEIRIFSRDEKKQEEMRLKHNNSRIKFYIGDTRDYSSILSAMNDVNFVFHAAALKQVPSCEFFPMEAFKTNVIGSENVMNAAIAKGVERMILLSTDKAVYPINAMGISKSMMEKLMIAKSRELKKNKIILCATRYGNVMGSRGSVIPLFIEQIKKNKTLTITDPAMTRFLMSLKDSVNLVLNAFENGEQGDIFVQKAPGSTVQDLALALQKIFKNKNKIKIIGTRHGEKLYESLVSREEMVKAEDLGELYRIPADIRDLNYSNFTIQGKDVISKQEDYTSHNTTRLNISEIIDLLLETDFIKEELND
jgi:UDP-N-acetylglucosamine 4,6-dehydratase